MQTPYNVPLLEYLTARQGLYAGHGTNFEGLPFRAELEIQSLLDGAVVQIRFRAIDEDLAFHEEITWISHDLIDDLICLWTVSSNSPGVLRHNLVEDATDDHRERRLVFLLGERDNKREFRQEITLDLLRDGGLEYRYGWGIPHEEFASRTRAVLKPSEQGSC